MKYRKLTINGDYSFGNNAYDFISDVEAVSQAISTKIKLFYGEWWENITIGMPMFESILGQLNQENVKMSATILLTERIKEVPEVKAVEKIDISFNERNMTIVSYVKTTLSQTVISEVTV